MSLVYKMIDSPVGQLKLVASDEGLVAVLWEMTIHRESHWANLSRETLIQYSSKRSDNSASILLGNARVSRYLSISEGHRFNEKFGKRYSPFRSVRRGAMENLPGNWAIHAPRELLEPQMAEIHSPLSCLATGSSVRQGN